MKYEVKFSKKVFKFLEKADYHIVKSFKQKVEILRRNPYSSKLDIKKIKGKDNHFRLRIGKFRFLYQIINDKILIFFYDADSRGDIYKN